MEKACDAFTRLPLPPTNVVKRGKQKDAICVLLETSDPIRAAASGGAHRLYQLSRRRIDSFSNFSRLISDVFEGVEFIRSLSLFLRSFLLPCSILQISMPASECNSTRSIENTFASNSATAAELFPLLPISNKNDDTKEEEEEEAEASFSIDLERHISFDAPILGNNASSATYLPLRVEGCCKILQTRSSIVLTPTASFLSKISIKLTRF
mmetsp:Transcript_16429/g.31128  ORF Transcript_16429/g.31128 Transcript_16429/m.31128 type:complete len:210 (+) Transcript_16429:499-1128(+)